MKFFALFIKKLIKILLILVALCLFFCSALQCVLPRQIMCKCVLYIICSPLCRMGSLLSMLHPSVATLTWSACYWTEDLRLMLKRGQVSRLTHDSYIFFLCPPSLMKPSQVKFLSSVHEGQRITSSLSSSPLVRADVKLNLVLLFIDPGGSWIKFTVISVWHYFVVCQLAGQ